MHLTLKFNNDNRENFAKCIRVDKNARGIKDLYNIKIKMKSKSYKNKVFT